MPTWVCPINPNHRFTGDWSNAWAQYLNHFRIDPSHSQYIASGTAYPDPNTPYYIIIPIDSLFGKYTQIDWIQANVLWKSKTGKYGYHFYLVHCQAYDKDMGIDANPHRLRVYHGVLGISGSFQVGKVPADPLSGRPGNRMDIDRALQYILIGAFPDTQADDHLEKVDYTIAGWL